jgi:hypothetical protein
VADRRRASRRPRALLRGHVVGADMAAALSDSSSALARCCRPSGCPCAWIAMALTTGARLPVAHSGPRQRRATEGSLRSCIGKAPLLRPWATLLLATNAFRVSRSRSAFVPRRNIESRPFRVASHPTRHSRSHSLLDALIATGVIAGSEPRRDAVACRKVGVCELKIIETTPGLRLSRTCASRAGRKVPSYGFGIRWPSLPRI